MSLLTAAGADYPGSIQLGTGRFAPAQCDPQSRGARAIVAAARLFGWLERGDAELTRALRGAVEIWHEGACGCCGRALSVPASVAMGLGPACAEGLAAAPAVAVVVREQPTAAAPRCASMPKGLWSLPDSFDRPARVAPMPASNAPARP